MTKTKKKIHALVVIIFILITIGASIFIWLRNRELSADWPIDYNAFGTLGDFYGGVFGTILLFISLYLVYKTYEEQVKQQIENRFFQLLRIHDSNVNYLKKIDEDIFNVCIRNINSFVKIICQYKDDQKTNWSFIDIVKLSYLYFFYGFIAFEEKRMNGINTINLAEIPVLNEYMHRQGLEYNNPAYNYIGIYFRQLFQTVTYINGRGIIDQKEKYELIKTLRVRLNIEEQYLLFLNSITSLGLEWEKGNKNNQHLITTYNMIKNIPKEYPGIKDVEFWNEEYGYPNVDYEFRYNEKTKKKCFLYSKFKCNKK